jgi:indolepyruvate ferredoxin oxidoreductase alpha subunit
VTARVVLPDYLQDTPGRQVLAMGNQAIARGALEAGIVFAAGYPGTPSTEILESLVPAAGAFGVVVDWAVNEKVAFEAALAVSLAGGRALVTTKHVGMNWISDPLLAANLGGTLGGIVIVAADDPGARSSHNEQDTRAYGFLAETPILEPADPAEALELTRWAFDLSERLRLPVVVRSVARVSHAWGQVMLGSLERLRALGQSGGVNGPREFAFEADPRFVVTGAGGKSLRFHQALHAHLQDQVRASEACPANRVQVPDKADLGILTAGVAYTYVEEALGCLSEPARSFVAVVKVGMSFPLPAGSCIELARRSSALLVVEEGEPVVELQFKALLAEHQVLRPVAGKRTGELPPTGELTPGLVRSAVTRLLNLEVATVPQGGGQLTAISAPERAAVASHMDALLPRRDLTMCTGCPHRATFYAMRRAVRRFGRRNCLFVGDIGCYSFAAQPPFELVDVKYTMGASLGVLSGFGRLNLRKRLFAVIGDSTFMHAGIPALVNAVASRIRAVIVIADNRTVGMTGQQPTLGTGRTATGAPAPEISMEDLIRALGVSYVAVVDAFDVEGVRQAVLQAADVDGPAIVISRGQCALDYVRSKTLARQTVIPLGVIEELCNGCGVCVKQLACPAIAWDAASRKARVLPDCTGCGICAAVCPKKAIVLVEGSSCPA